MWSPNLKFLHQAFYRKSLPTPAESECLCLDPVASFHQLNLEQITQLTYPVFLICVSLLWFSRSAMSNSLRPHGLQRARLPCPSPSPWVCSNSCPSSQWCHPTISSSVPPLFLLPSVFPSIRVFSSELALCIRWPKYWSFSFSISPSNEYSELISFRMGCFDLLAVKGLLSVFWRLYIKS